MAWPGTASVGSGPPGPVAPSIGTAIVKPICESGSGVRARLIPEPSDNHVDASAGVCSSEVALFLAQVPDPRRTRSLIVTKVAPICHSALRSSPLMTKLRSMVDPTSVTEMPIYPLLPADARQIISPAAGTDKLLAQVMPWRRKISVTSPRSSSSSSAFRALRPLAGALAGLAAGTVSAWRVASCPRPA